MGSPNPQGILAVAILALTLACVALVIVIFERRRLETAQAGSLIVVVLVMTLAGAFCLLKYVQTVDAQTNSRILQTYELFSKLRRIDRLVNKDVAVDVSNVSSTYVNTTTWVYLSVTPYTAFFTDTAHESHPKSRLYLKAVLTAPEFNVSPILDETQLVSHDSDTFAWMITPKESGEQNLNLRATLFRLTDNGMVVDRETLVNQMRGINVKPVIGMDVWLSIATALIGLLGSSGVVLIIQFILGRLPTKKDVAETSPAVTRGVIPQSPVHREQ